MSQAREAILKRIRAATADNPHRAENTTVAAEVESRLRSPKRHTLPALPEARIKLLIEKMESVQMSVVRLQSSKDVFNAVDDFLCEQGVQGEMTVSPALAHLNWPTGTSMGRATGTESTGVTACFAAIAETGSIALASGPDSPVTLGFLPENHIVVVKESQVLDYVEDVWSAVRKLSNEPRAINLITGPSRTGDIEQTIELGAHGPRRLHVLLISGE